ncbi:hypothetical protein [Arthrobacter sp. ok362]|uniref:hypothetical protein n=1 Tax=Arthrobacter sp. ok362 TaxID=1761745 RepID=UPI00088C1D3F|nr:hypothetical protein [Arthrobacter sp. ok362]SDL41852.1 hypothetical protein SAMN04487913_109122 [Arthrobacter sp. ok362]
MSEVRGTEGQKPGTTAIPAAGTPVPDTRPPENPGSGAPPAEAPDSGAPTAGAPGSGDPAAGAPDSANPDADPDAWLPAWLVGRPLTAGWAWAGFWAVLIVADEFLDLAGWSWYVLVGMAALPTLLATVALLHATPRRYLKPRRDTVLGHFFVRFLALIAGFLVWGVSVVMSASISTTVQSLVGESEREVTAVGFNLLLAGIPLVVSVLWLAFIIRCAWFLRRLRGWKQTPEPGTVPKKFLRGRPRLRRVVVGLAHPGLLLVAGLGTSVLAFLLGAVELTINVLK